MPRLLHDDDGMTYACPNCDHAGGVYRRVHCEREYEHECRCDKCATTFPEDDVVERETKPNPIGDAAVAAENQTDDDGLPAQMSPKHKEIIRQSRG